MGFGKAFAAAQRRRKASDVTVFVQSAIDGAIRRLAAGFPARRRLFQASGTSTSCTSLSPVLVSGFVNHSTYLNGKYTPTGQMCLGLPTYTNGYGGAITARDLQHSVEYWFIGNTSVLDCTGAAVTGYALFSNVFSTFVGNVPYWNTASSDFNSLPMVSRAGIAPPLFNVTCMADNNPLPPVPVPCSQNTPLWVAGYTGLSVAMNGMYSIVGMCAGAPVYQNTGGFVVSLNGGGARNLDNSLAFPNWYIGNSSLLFCENPTLMGYSTISSTPSQFPGKLKLFACATLRQKLYQNPFRKPCHAPQKKT